MSLPVAADRSNHTLIEIEPRTPGTGPGSQNKGAGWGRDRTAPVS